MRSFTLTAAVAAVTTLAGCAQMSSGEVATNDIDARIMVTADGSGETLVEAELLHDRATWSTYIDLDAGDALMVNAEGRTRTLGEGEVLNMVGYGARLPGDRGGTEFQVSLSRPAFESAPNSFVRLPARFRLYTPPRSTYDVDYDTVVLEWDGISHDEMFFNFEGRCISDGSYGISVDDGVFLLRPGMLAAQSHWDGAPCEIRVTAERLRSGTLDATYGAGRIEARQVRTTSFWIEGF